MVRPLAEALCSAISTRKQDGFILIYVVVILAIIILAMGASVSALALRERTAELEENRYHAYYSGESVLLAAEAQLNTLQGDPNRWQELLSQLAAGTVPAWGLTSWDVQTFTSGPSQLDSLSVELSGNALCLAAVTSCANSRVRMFQILRLPPLFAGGIVTTGDVLWQSSRLPDFPIAAGGRITGLTTAKKGQGAILPQTVVTEELLADTAPLAASEIINLDDLPSGSYSVSSQAKTIISGRLQGDILLVFPPESAVEIGDLVSMADYKLVIIAGDIATTSRQGYDGSRMLLIAGQELVFSHHGNFFGAGLAIGDKNSKIIVEPQALINYQAFSAAWLQEQGFNTEITRERKYIEGNFTD